MSLNEWQLERLTRWNGDVHKLHRTIIPEESNITYCEHNINYQTEFRDAKLKSTKLTRAPRTGFLPKELYKLLQLRYVTANWFPWGRGKREGPLSTHGCHDNGVLLAPYCDLGTTTQKPRNTHGKSLYLEINVAVVYSKNWVSFVYLIERNRNLTSIIVLCVSKAGKNECSLLLLTLSFKTLQQNVVLESCVSGLRWLSNLFLRLLVALFLLI